MTMQTTFARPADGSYRLLALGAVLGPVLFTVAWIVLGVLQPPTQNIYGVMGGISGAVSNPISGLGVGPQALPFNIAFVACGLLTAVGVIGSLQLIGGPPTARWFSAVLLALSPLGLALAGIFTLAVSIGLHSLAAALLFVSPVISFVVAGLYLRGQPAWRAFGTRLVVASPLTLVLVIVYALTFNQTQVAAGHGIAGLTERILALEVQGWYATLGWLALRRSR